MRMRLRRPIPSRWLAKKLLPYIEPAIPPRYSVTIANNYLRRPTKGPVIRVDAGKVLIHGNIAETDEQ